MNGQVSTLRRRRHAERAPPRLAPAAAHAARAGAAGHADHPGLPLGKSTRTGLLAWLLVGLALYWLYEGMGYRPLLLLQLFIFSTAATLLSAKLLLVIVDVNRVTFLRTLARGLILLGAACAGIEPAGDVVPARSIPTDRTAGLAATLHVARQPDRTTDGSRGNVTASISLGANGDPHRTRCVRTLTPSARRHALSWLPLLPRWCECVVSFSCRLSFR